MLLRWNKNHFSSFLKGYHWSKRNIFLVGESPTLSQLEQSKDKDVTNVRHWQILERKYSIRVKRLGVVIEELKQRIDTIAEKLRRYLGRADRFRQDRMF